MAHQQRVQTAVVLWVLVVSIMVAASAFPSYVQYVDPQFRDLGCEGCHAGGTPSSVILKAKLIPPSSDPTIDGVSDPVWDSALPIRINLTGGFDPISLPGDESWSANGAPLPWGTGNATTVTMRALYDGETPSSNLFLQVEWLDETDSSARSPWYFDNTTGKWTSANSTLFNEDKVAMFWEMGEVTGFDAGGCLVTCHVTTPNRTDVRKYTPVAGDLIDMWVWRAARLNGVSQVDDQYMDYNVTARGIHNDPVVNSSLGYKTNTQNLNNGSASLAVPMYWIPGRTGYNWILLSEIDANVAKQIVSVDSANALHDEDGTTVPGDAVIPSLYTSAFDGDRGHIAGKASRTATGWLLEARRTLQTTALINNETVPSPNDVQFSDLNHRYYFAIAVFDNVGSGHQWHPGPYRLQFGEAAKPVPTNLDIWGTSVAAASFLVSGVGALTLASAHSRKQAAEAAKKEGKGEAKDAAEAAVPTSTKGGER